MKKFALTILILFTLMLTACGSASSETQSGSVPMGGDASTSVLPEQTQLVIGTIQLEGTEQAITAEQAAELLPLWQVYQSLSASDTAAQEEVDALFEQIQDTMTSEQKQAIADMQLTQEDVFAFMQEQGISMGGGQGLSAEQIATAQASRSSGGGFTPPDGGMPMGAAPGGGPAGGMGQGMSGQGLSSDQIATAQAARSSGAGGFNRTPSVLINVLIQFLEEKVGS